MMNEMAYVVQILTLSLFEELYISHSDRSIKKERIGRFPKFICSCLQANM